jgi:hypothetical protein
MGLIGTPPGRGPLDQTFAQDLPLAQGRDGQGLKHGFDAEFPRNRAHAPSDPGAIVLTRHRHHTGARALGRSSR